MDDAAQQQVVAALSPAARYGLVAPPGSPAVPVRELTDRDRLAAVVADHAAVYPGASTAVVATLWWYLASAVLVGPAAAGALVGVPLSADLDDLGVHLGAAGMPLAVVSTRLGPADPGPALGATLGALIGTACAVAGLRPRPLWAIAADSLSTRLLGFGRDRRELDRATALAGELVAASTAPVPLPRFVDVDGARFLVRASCCQLYRASGELCTSCPRRPGDERLRLLRAAAPGFR